MVGAPEAVRIFSNCWKFAQQKRPRSVEEAIDFLMKMPIPACVGTLLLFDFSFARFVVILRELWII
jgi:hypothetical protein